MDEYPYEATFKITSGSLSNEVHKAISLLKDRTVTVIGPMSGCGSGFVLVKWPDDICEKCEISLSKIGLRPSILKKEN